MHSECHKQHDTDGRMKLKALQRQLPELMLSLRANNLLQVVLEAIYLENSRKEVSEVVFV